MIDADWDVIPPANWREVQRRIAVYLIDQAGWGVRDVARFLGCGKSEAHRIYRGDRLGKKSRNFKSGPRKQLRES